MFAYIIVDFELTGILLAPRSIFLIVFLIDTFLIGLSRFGYRIIRRFIRGDNIQFKKKKRVLVYGAGEAGAIIIKEMKSHHEMKSTPIAIIDDDASLTGRKINGVPILGTGKDIVTVIDSRNIEEVIIAIPSMKRKEINEVYNICGDLGVLVKILPSVSQLINDTVSIKEIRDVSIEDLLGRDPIELDNTKVFDYVKGRVVLITGAGGSIGSELSRQIASYMPDRLILLDNYENNLYEINNELKNKYKELDLVAIIANVREKHRMETLFEKYKPEVVFHAAAHKHVPLMEDNPTEAVKNNVFGTLNLVEAAHKNRVRRFLFISTDKAVNPTNIMGATKRMAEMIIQAFNGKSPTEYVAVRFGNVLGSNGSVIPLFKKQIEEGGPVTVTHKDVIRYFMTIPEAVALVLQAGGMASGGEVFVLDMGEPVKIFDLAKNLIRLSGFEPEEDIEIKVTGLRPGEKLYEELLMDEEGLKTTQNEKIFIAKPTFSDVDYLLQEIDCLKEMVILHSDDVKDYIKNIVPTYKMVDDKREESQQKNDEQRSRIAADVVKIRNDINHLFKRDSKSKHSHLSDKLISSSKILCNGIPKVSFGNESSKAFQTAKDSLNDTRDKLACYVDEGIISEEDFKKLANKIDGTSTSLKQYIEKH
jgi:FlaA1/EpsC-like NDP-sugar epimerase